MRRSPKPYLHDIVRAADEILRMISGKTLDDYLADETLRSAVERQFIIIGEAMYQMKYYFPRLGNSIPEHRELIGFRHVLVHAYNQVEDEVAWGVIETRLRRVRDAAAKMLAQSQ